MPGDVPGQTICARTPGRDAPPYPISRPMPLSLRRLTRLLSLSLLLSGSALAQATGTLAGVVLDADTGAPLAAANVSLPDLNRGAVTDAEGRFFLDAVPIGTHVLRASTVGYEDARQVAEVEAGATTRVVLVLTAADARIGEVVVEGRAVNLVGTAGSASEGLVGQTQLAQRPLLRVGEVLELVEIEAPLWHRRPAELSGGQQQAVAIARALLYDPPVMILDEPTASLDPASENRLMQRLHHITRDRTMILITHKGSLLQLCNRLVLMDRAKIIADGDKDTVIKRLQQGEFKRGGETDAKNTNQETGA